jgi:16S rRNA (uracil1498-N3)-methyltransferase
LLTGQLLSVAGSAGNHIARVLRLRAGDALTLFDGRGGEYAAHIREIRKDTVLLDVLEHLPLERESPSQLTLAQGISRGERMDWVVQKATELGVARILPLFTERSVVHLDEKQASRKVQHWRSIAVAACEQSGRNRVPEIAAPAQLHDFLQAGKLAGTGLLLSPRAPLRIGDIPALAGGATVLIGPEGGLADFEQAAAISHGFTPVRMGPRVLRTETAAVCALTLLQQQFGDL